VYAPTSPREHIPEVSGGFAPARSLPNPMRVVALPEPTVRVAPLEMPLPGTEEPRPFLVELALTLKRFAVPLAVLIVIAVFAGGYFAFDGAGGKKRKPVPPPALKTEAAPVAEPPAAAPVEATREPTIAPAPPTVAPTVTPIEAEPTLSSAIAEGLDVTRAAESAELANGAVIPGAADDGGGEEIEMAAVDVEKAKERDERRQRRREERREKREELAKQTKPQSQPVEKKKTDKKEIAEAVLAANIANKTAAASGKLSVTSNVPAMIYLDGRSTGMMTPKKFAVPAGDHKITLLEPNTRKAKTQDVEILAGKTASVDKTF
jgi:hypothetical protein